MFERVNPLRHDGPERAAEEKREGRPPSLRGGGLRNCRWRLTDFGEIEFHRLGGPEAHAKRLVQKGRECGRAGLVDHPKEEGLRTGRLVGVPAKTFSRRYESR